MSDNKWIKDHLERIENKVDKTSDEVTSVRIMSEKNTVILEEHQRRSEANEKAVELLQADLNKKDRDTNKRIDPLANSYQRVVGVLKVGGVCLTIAGIFVGILKAILSLF